MKKFKYLKISNSKKLRYIDNYFKKKLYIIFLPGFMSDIDGKKPQAFKKYAVKNKLGFLPSKSDINPCKKTIMKSLFFRLCFRYLILFDLVIFK